MRSRRAAVQVAATRSHEQLGVVRRRGRLALVIWCGSSSGQVDNGGGGQGVVDDSGKRPAGHIRSAKSTVAGDKNTETRSSQFGGTRPIVSGQ
jgi:hypothetical protein